MIKYASLFVAYSGIVIIIFFSLNAKLLFWNKFA